MELSGREVLEHVRLRGGVIYTEGKMVDMGGRKGNN